MQLLKYVDISTTRIRVRKVCWHSLTIISFESIFGLWLGSNFKRWKSLGKPLKLKSLFFRFVSGTCTQRHSLSRVIQLRAQTRLSFPSSWLANPTWPNVSWNLGSGPELGPEYYPMLRTCPTINFTVLKSQMNGFTFLVIVNYNDAMHVRDQISTFSVLKRFLCLLS